MVPLGSIRRFSVGRRVDRQVEPIAPVDPGRGGEDPALEHYVAPISGGRVHDITGAPARTLPNWTPPGDRRKGPAWTDVARSWLAALLASRYQRKEKGW